MLKRVLTVAAVVLLIGFAILRTGGGKYVNRYKAVGFVHSNTERSAFMNFHTFDGTMVFKLKNKAPSGSLHVSGTVEKGSMKVYWDYGSGKEFLLDLKPGPLWEVDMNDLEEGTVYLIVETDGKCVNGSLNFDLE